MSQGTEEGKGRTPESVVVKGVLVSPESCSSLVSMLPSLMRQISSVPQSFGNGRLNPVSEGFNMTKVMTLGRRERRSSTSQVHSPWTVHPRSPVANMPRSEDMQQTTMCHEFSCGCTTPQCEPGQSKGPAAHQHPGDLPVPWPREVFPLCGCASAVCF